MEIIKATTGRTAGRISVARTLASMSIGERWNTDTADVNVDYLRNACSKMARTLGRDFSVINTKKMDGRITVVRLR